METNYYDTILNLWKKENKISSEISDSDILHVEEKLKIKFPELLKLILKTCNGGTLLWGELYIYPLLGDEWSIENMKESIEDCNLFVPNNVTVFADDGGGDFYGFYSFSPEYEPLIIKFDKFIKDLEAAIFATSLENLIINEFVIHSWPENPQIAKSFGIDTDLIRLTSSELDYIKLFSRNNFPITEDPNQYIQKLTDNNLKDWCNENIKYLVKRV